MAIAEIFPGLMLAAWNSCLVTEVLRLEQRLFSSTARITSRSDLLALRIFIRQDMLASLLLLCTLTISTVGSVVGFIFPVDALKWMALGFGVLIPLSPFLVAAASTRRKVRELTVAPELEREVRRLLRAWSSRVIPIAAAPSVKQGAVSVIANAEPGSLALRDEKRGRVDLYWRERSARRNEATKLALWFVLITGSASYVLLAQREDRWEIAEQADVRRGLWEGLVGRTRIDGLEYGKHYAIAILHEARLPERRVIRFSEELGETTIEVRMKPCRYLPRWCATRKVTPSRDDAKLGSLILDVEPAGAFVQIAKIQDQWVQQELDHARRDHSCESYAPEAY